MSLVSQVYINELFLGQQVFKQIGNNELNNSDYNLFISDGTVPGTINGNLYLQNPGGVLIDLTTGGGGGGIAALNNVGTGAGIWRDTLVGTANLKSLTGGSGINVNSLANELEINNTGVLSLTNTGVGSVEIFKNTTAGVASIRTLQAGPGIAVSEVGDTINITNTGAGAAYEDLSTSIGTDPAAGTEISDFNLNTGNRVVLTLANGSSLGQKKKLVVSRFTAGSELELQITSFVNGTGLLFTSLGQSASLVWTAAGWAIDVTGADLLP